MVTLISVNIDMNRSVQSARVAGRTSGTVTSLKARTLAVPEAKAALVAGDKKRHDALIARAIEEQEVPDTIALGQVSMTDVVGLLPPEHQSICITSPQATVSRLRLLLD